MEPQLESGHLILELRGPSTSTQPAQLTQQQRQELVNNLPRLHEEDVISLGQRDSGCPICFTSVLALLAEEETAFVMDSPAHPQEELGVTRLAQTWQCGHLFCRRDISRWIRDGHGSCPICRRPLVNPSTGGNVNEPPAAELNDYEHTQALFDQLEMAIRITDAPVFTNDRAVSSNDYAEMFS